MKHSPSSSGHKKVAWVVASLLLVTVLGFTLVGIHDAVVAAAKSSDASKSPCAFAKKTCCHGDDQSAHATAAGDHNHNHEHEDADHHHEDSHNHDDHDHDHQESACPHLQMLKAANKTADENAAIPPKAKSRHSHKK